MTHPEDAEIIVGRIHELKRRKRETSNEFNSLEQDVMLMVCDNEGQAARPSVLVTYDRQGAWEFAAICNAMRKATNPRTQRSRQRMLVRSPKNQH